MIARVGLVAILFTTSFSAAADKSQWMQWRGNSRTCQIEGAAGWPEKLSGSLKEMYRVPLGPGYSGPIVSADRVFLTETVNKEREVTRAVDRASGKELWKIEWEGAMSVPFFAASNGSWIRATPAFDGERLFVPGMLDVLVAINAADGSEAWRQDFRQLFKTSGQSFGFVCSPLIDAGALYVQTSGGLVKMSCETGEIIWRSLNEAGGMMGGAFSSPMIGELAGTRQLIVQTRAKLCGVDLESGKELWSMAIASFRDMNILTPTIIGDRIFTSCYGGGAHMYEVTNSSQGWAIKEIWKNTTEAYMSSPVVVGDAIYLHLRNQRLACLNPTNGEPFWRTTPFGKYWSMAVNGDQVLALDETGDLILFKANQQEFQLSDRLHVSDASAWAHLAIADEQVFVRALDELIVYSWGQ
jgi:outer membrane protein assembly factor BamB